MGTTTSYQASHPITQGLGADSAAFLTEIGFVAVPDMDNLLMVMLQRWC